MVDNSEKELQDWRGKFIHKDIDPTISGKCSTRCQQYKTGWSVFCKITKHYERDCVPFLKSEIERMQYKLLRYEDECETNPG